MTMTNHVDELLSEERIIVFLGPTLRSAEARSWLPSACWLPPARCGDVVRALRLRPQLILLIDGYYERTAAVWHKELLLALEHGVTVWGAASMGALRAAELNVFGVVGVGEVYEDFAAGRLTDDDEVAVLHDLNFRVGSDAMVDVRATLLAAVRGHVVSEATAAHVVRCAKALFYPERTLRLSLALAEAQGADASELAALRAHIASGGYVHQKRADALTALSRLADLVDRPLVRPPAVQAERAAGVRTLYHHVMCRPFPHALPELSVAEQRMAAARFLGPCYGEVRRIAELLHTMAQLGLAPSDALGASAPTDPAADAELTVLIEVLLILSDEPSDRHGPPVPQRRVQLAADSPARYAALRAAACLLRAIEQRARARGLSPAAEDVQAACDRLRYERGLKTRQGMMNWLQQQGWSSADFGKRMTIAARYERLVRRNLLDALAPCAPQSARLWLLEALQLTGLERLADEVLFNPRAVLVAVADDDEADARDFPDGYEGYVRERDHLCERAQARELSHAG